MAFIGQDRAEFNLKRQQAQAQYQLGQQMLRMMQPQQAPTPQATPQVPPAGQGQKPPGSEWQGAPWATPQQRAVAMQDVAGLKPSGGQPMQAQQAPDPRRQGPNGMQLNPATGLPMGWMPGQATTGFTGPMMDKAQQSVGTYNQSQQTAIQNAQQGAMQQNQQNQQQWDKTNPTQYSWFPGQAGKLIPKAQAAGTNGPVEYAQDQTQGGIPAQMVPKAQAVMGPEAVIPPQQYQEWVAQNNKYGGNFQEQQGMRAGMKEFERQQTVPGYLQSLQQGQSGPQQVPVPQFEQGYGMLPMPQMDRGAGSLVPPNAQQLVSPQIPGGGMINDVYSLLQNGTQLQSQEAQQWLGAQGQGPQMPQQAPYAGTDPAGTSPQTWDTSPVNIPAQEWEKRESSRAWEHKPLSRPTKEYSTWMAGQTAMPGASLNLQGSEGLNDMTEAWKYNLGASPQDGNMNFVSGQPLPPSFVGAPANTNGLMDALLNNAGNPNQPSSLNFVSGQSNAQPTASPIMPFMEFLLRLLGQPKATPKMPNDGMDFRVNPYEGTRGMNYK